MKMANRSRRAAGFTLIELLVVVAIISLLISILLPSLQGAREQGKKAKCLANVRSIGTAMHLYASEQSDIIGPIHPMQARAKSASNGQATTALYRTIEWFTYGGRSAPDRFLAGPSGGGVEVNDTGFVNVTGVGNVKGAYAAKTRPLNAYLGVTDLEPTIGSNGQPAKLGAAYNLPMFECPSDQGYPDFPEEIVDDSQQENAERRLYDTVGNSYRAAMGGGHSVQACFLTGSWGARTSQLRNTQKLVLMGEPTFFNMIGTDDGEVEPDPVLLTGWHKRLLTDNVLFVDGHADATMASGKEHIDEQTWLQMGQCNGNWKLTTRGGTWQLDGYPTPGRKIRGNAVFAGTSTACWPYR